MLSLKFVFRQSKNFTSDDEIQMPPTVPFNHYLNGLKKKEKKGDFFFFFFF